MRNLHELDEYRVMNGPMTDYIGDVGNDKCGAFRIIFKGSELRIIASAYDGWDHISVSLQNRTPNWYEMEHVAKLFFRSNEIAVQYHMPIDMHIDFHPNCLHWWRPQGKIILLPPRTMV